MNKAYNLSKDLKGLRSHARRIRVHNGHSGLGWPEAATAHPGFLAKEMIQLMK